MLWSSKAGCARVLWMAEWFPGGNGLAQVARGAGELWDEWDMRGEEDEQAAMINQEPLKSSNQQRQCQLKTPNEALAASVPVEKKHQTFLCPFPGVLF